MESEHKWRALLSSNVLKDAFPGEETRLQLNFAAVCKLGGVHRQDKSNRLKHWQNDCFGGELQVDMRQQVFSCDVQDVDRSAVVSADGQEINSNRYIALMAYITLR